MIQKYRNQCFTWFKINENKNSKATYKKINMPQRIPNLII